MVAKHIYKGDTYPEDLQELIELLNSNKIKLDKLKAIKLRTGSEKSEMNKRIKLDISIRDDINILKDHYKIPRNHNYTEGQDVSNNELMYYKRKPIEFEELVEKEYDNSEALNEWQVEKIKNIASKILTKRQLVVFSLYYESRLTQQEIASIINDDQRNVADAIKRIIKKIKEKI